MSFVLDKEGNYLQVYGESAGGGGGTSDHSQLTNLDYANAGHTGFMSSANYLPSGTVINVNLDGTGDFTDIKTAINSLTGKWSDGVVTVKVAAGNYSISSQIDIDGNNFNIPLFCLEGDSNSTTILTATDDFVNTGSMFRVFRCRAEISKLKVTNNLTLPTYTNPGVRAFTLAYQCNVNIHDIAVDKYFSGIGAIAGDVLLQGTNSFSNGGFGIESTGGGIFRLINCTNTMTNLTTAYYAGKGMLIGSPTATIYTNVTSHTDPAANTNGAIYGFSE